jgi:hypothetical protein
MIWYRKRRHLHAGALALTALLVAGGCQSGGAKASPGASPSAMSDTQLLTIGREYAQCIRDHGIPNYPDPVVDSGRLAMPPDADGGSAKQALQGNQAAQDACRSILDRLPASARKDHPPTPEELQQMLRFSQCVREHGVPEWPDPTNDGVFPIIGTPLEGEGKSARTVAAFQACRQYWDQGIRVK